MFQKSPRAPQALAEHVPAEGTPDTGFLSPDSSCQDPLIPHRVGAALQSSRPLFPQNDSLSSQLGPTCLVYWNPGLRGPNDGMNIYTPCGLEQITTSLSLSLQFCKMGVAERGLRHLASMGGCSPHVPPTPSPPRQHRIRPELLLPAHALPAEVEDRPHGSGAGLGLCLSLT